MNLKSYLKGLGLGIIIATIVLLVATNLKDNSMSDEDIIKRAKELGLVESTTLTPSSLNSEINNDQVLDENPNDKLNNDSDSSGDSKTDESLKDDDIKDKLTDDDKESNDNLNDDKSNDLEAIKDNDLEKVEEYVIITIKPGEGSEIVSTKVREAGFTDDGKAFNKFLVDNGYDKRLKVGDHEIPVQSTFEEIAKLLCSN